MAPAAPFIPSDQHRLRHCRRCHRVLILLQCSRLLVQVGAVQEQAVPNQLVVLGPGLEVTMPAWTDRMPVLEASPKPQSLFSMLTRDLRSSRPDPTPPALDLLPIHITLPLSLFSASREQEGAESASEEGQLPQVVEELKDLQVAPGTRLAKFQLKVKGEGEREGGSGNASHQ